MAVTALLVIDVQVGAFDGKLIPPIDRGVEIISLVRTLVNFARNSDWLIVFVQHCAPEGQLLTEGERSWELHPDIGVTEADRVVLKRESSAFQDTDLHAVLKENEIEDVVLCGLQSEHCVTNTAKAALDLGLRVLVVEDAHSTWLEGDMTADAIVQRQNELLTELGIGVEPTKSIVEEGYSGDA